MIDDIRTRERLPTLLQGLFPNLSSTMYEAPNMHGDLSGQ